MNLFLQAEGLNGEDRATHPFARARLGEQGLQTSVQWQTTSPVWEEALSFRQALLFCSNPPSLIFLTVGISFTVIA